MKLDNKQLIEYLKENENEWIDTSRLLNYGGRSSYDFCYLNGIIEVWYQGETDSYSPEEFMNDFEGSTWHITAFIEL